MPTHIYIYITKPLIISHFANANLIFGKTNSSSAVEFVEEFSVLKPPSGNLHFEGKQKIIRNEKSRIRGQHQNEKKLFFIYNMATKLSEAIIL